MERISILKTLAMSFALGATFGIIYTKKFKKKQIEA